MGRTHLNRSSLIVVGILILIRQNTAILEKPPYVCEHYHRELTLQNFYCVIKYKYKISTNKYMKMHNRIPMSVLVFLFCLIGLFYLVEPTVASAATSPLLGDANSFSILAKTLISDADPVNTSIAGDVGLDNAGSNITGLTSAAVAGTIYDTNGTGPDGVIGNDPTLMTSARAANTAAYGDLAIGDNAPSGCTNIPVELGGQTLVPGVYCSGGVFTLTSGVLTLSGTGTWVFQSTATLVTSSGGSIVGGDACSVWWRVPSSATLGTNSYLTGNILALTSITLQSGATLNGRALAQNGAVTLDGNTIVTGTCSSTSINDEDSSDDNDNEEVAIKVTKKADPKVLSAGPGNVTYTYKVTNPGDVSLKHISVKDDKCSPVEFISGDSDHDSKLDKHEEWIYGCTKKVSETETNKATAKGTANHKDVKDTDKASVTVSFPSLPNAGVDPDEAGGDSRWNVFWKKIVSL